MFPLLIGAFSLENLNEAKVESKEIIFFYFIDLSLSKYDPKGVVQTHCKEIGFEWYYRNYKGYDEDKV